MVVQVLMVAEKPSLAKSLGEILSCQKCSRRKSLCSACDVYEFQGPFPGGRGVAANFKMTSVCGHVMSLDFPQKFNSWDKVDPVGGFMCCCILLVNIKSPILLVSMATIDSHPKFYCLNDLDK